ncbi:MAG: hypothetical protein NVSMB47_00340 [Polyangiales bacterium]
MIQAGPLAAMVVALAACGFPEHTYRDARGMTPDSGASADANESDARGDGDRDAAPGTEVGDVGDVSDLGADARPTGPPPTRCAPETTTSACDVVLDLPGGTVVLDGAGDEFCAAKIPARTFTVEGAAHTQPAPPPAGLTQRVAVRAGLSAYGFHVHVQVLDDPRIVVSQPDLARGDAVEIFLRGAFPSALTGELAHDHALHVVLVPPSAGSGADAAIYDGESRGGALDPALWAARLVDGGYEVELRVPWTMLGDQPVPGSHVGLDVAVDVKDDPAATSRAARALLEDVSLPSSTSCAGAIQPSCDDRTWCLAPAYTK